MPQPVELKGIDHPALALSDVEGITKWYQSVLGYEEVSRKGDSVIIVRAPDGTYIEMMQQNDDRRAERRNLTPGISHLAFRVADLDEAIAKLDAHGVSWLGEIVPAAGGGRLRSFSDPDGNMLQVVQR